MAKWLLPLEGSSAAEEAKLEESFRNVLEFLITTKTFMNMPQKTAVSAQSTSRKLKKLPPRNRTKNNTKEIGGKKCLALIDTGASCSILDETFFREVNDNISNGRTEIGEDWTGATFETEIISVGSLTIGDIRFPKHEFVLLDFKQIFPYMEYPIVAIIGASTLSCKKFSFNLIDGYLLIEE